MWSRQDGSRGLRGSVLYQYCTNVESPPVLSDSSAVVRTRDYDLITPLLVGNNLRNFTRFTGPFDRTFQ
jgi:hypothetical protein